MIKETRWNIAGYWLIFLTKKIHSGFFIKLHNYKKPPTTKENLLLPCNSKTLSKRSVICNTITCLDYRFNVM